MRVLTYNIRHGQGEDGWVSNARVARVVRDAAPDVVGMNEVWRLTRSFDQPAVLADKLGFDVAFEANASFGPWQQGNLILSRGRIVRWDNIELPHGLERRGCLLAEIALDGVRIAFASTHLSLERRVRSLQLAALVRELPRDLPLVLAGDMNCTAEELEPLREILELAPAPASFPALIPFRRLDHIAFSAHWRLSHVSAIRTIASDHLPVVADLEPA